MMKFLLDQGLPRSTISALLNRGFCADHVGQLGMAKAGDEELLDAARDGGAIAVSLDADFHSILAATRATSPSVIRIRIEGLKGEDVADIIEQVVMAAKTELELGSAVTVTKGGIRARLLPLI